LGSGAEPVRAAAARALGQLGPSAASAIPSLITALNDVSPIVRETCAQALGELAATAAASELKRLTGDSDVAVRAAATTALAKMGSGVQASSPAPDGGRISIPK
jgi:HEAT repeat protein